MNGLFFVAQAAKPVTGSPFGALLPLIIIFFIFYFLLIMPQQKKQKVIKKMLSELKEGDDVITVGGIIGTVQKLKDNVVTVKLSETVSVKFMRNSIAKVMVKDFQQTTT